MSRGGGRGLWLRSTGRGVGLRLSTERVQMRVPAGGDTVRGDLGHLWSRRRCESPQGGGRPAPSQAARASGLLAIKILVRLRKWVAMEFFPSCKHYGGEHARGRPQTPAGTRLGLLQGEAGAELERECAPGAASTRARGAPACRRGHGRAPSCCLPFQGARNARELPVSVAETNLNHARVDLCACRVPGHASVRP